MWMYTCVHTDVHTIFKKKSIQKGRYGKAPYMGRADSFHLEESERKTCNDFKGRYGKAPILVLSITLLRMESLHKCQEVLASGKIRCKESTTCQKQAEQFQLDLVCEESKSKGKSLLEA